MRYRNSIKEVVAGLLMGVLGAGITAGMVWSAIAQFYAYGIPTDPVLFVLYVCSFLFPTGAGIFLVCASLHFLHREYQIWRYNKYLLDEQEQ
jgi:F0F1-type ATP synthase membrane subunit c/vacuolar-type H+-ATPase subunit K